MSQNNLQYFLCIFSLSVTMRVFTQNKKTVRVVLLVTFVSVLFLWHQSESNLQDNLEDTNSFFPQLWPSFSQTKSGQFPSVESGGVQDSKY